VFIAFARRHPQQGWSRPEARLVSIAADQIFVLHVASLRAVTLRQREARKQKLLWSDARPSAAAALEPISATGKANARLKIQFAATTFNVRRYA
jgi:hypothetical protein